MQRKNILNNVVKYYDNEADKGCLTIPLPDATKRASAISAVSETIRRIHKEDDNNSSNFTSPKKKKVKTIIENVNLHNFNLDVIQRIIQHFCIKLKKCLLFQNY